MAPKTTHPPFPEIGSTIASKYFCIGRLGKGTFCSIHKCIDLSYAHHDPKGDVVSPHVIEQKEPPIKTEDSREADEEKQRIVAAKAELATFLDSGVIDGEAAVLKFLHATLPPGSVPTFVDYVRPAPQFSSTDPVGSGEGVSAIIMEYLPGEDMHLLRDRHCSTLEGKDKSEKPGSTPRRVSVEDAVYLVADVMLPLLKRMHGVGMVHRDVKPSNVVRTGTTNSNRSFKLVDFGLSKSFVVPKDSTFADSSRPWKGLWMSPSFSLTNADSTISNARIVEGNEPKDMAKGGCIRLERDSAEFRGTSMYASLRVHQGKDHCPRDDIWGLLYVFCDLVSGGLPWMSHAASRDRNSCQILKEIVLGERGNDDWGDEGENGRATAPNPEMMPKNGEDFTEWLLYGAEYHMAKFKKDQAASRASHSGEEAESLPLPEPLSLSRNQHYVECLRKAFRHVASLGFVEMPNYDLIDECLRGFLVKSDTIEESEIVQPIDWKDRRSGSKKRRLSNTSKCSAIDTGGVAWDLLDIEDADPLDNNALIDAENNRRAALEAAAAAAMDDVSRVTGGASSAANMTYASIVVSTNIDPGSSLSGEAADLARLPLQLQFALAQAEYNAQHPTSVPRHLALRDWMALAVPLAHGTWNAAAWERGNHRTDDDGYRNEVYMSMLQKCIQAAEPFDSFSDRNCFYYPSEDGVTRKRRRIGTSTVDDADKENESPLLVLSRVFFSLRLALDLERGKNFAPPPKLSFGFGR